MRVDGVWSNRANLRFCLNECGVVRCDLYLVAACFRRAVLSVVRHCLKLQRDGIRSFKPDVCVGSSWGGAMLIYSILCRYWSGPTLLLAPAHYKVHRYTRGFSMDERFDERRIENELSLAKLAPFPLASIHGTADTTVPPSHSKRLLGRLPYAEVELVSDDHRLMSFLTTGDNFRSRIDRLHARGLQAQSALAAAAIAAGAGQSASPAPELTLS